MIIVAGTVHVDPEHLDEFFREARAIVPTARSADGNASFSCAVEDAEEGSVLFFERWRDEAALDAHLSRPEVRAIFGRWAARLRNDVRKYDVANERDPRRQLCRSLT